MNPSYSLAKASEFNEALSKVDLKISTALSMDETASRCEYVCPDRHFLKVGVMLKLLLIKFLFIQPTIQPLFDSRQFQESLLVWTGNKISYYDFLKDYWSKLSWSSSLHNGITELNEKKYSVTKLLQKYNQLKLKLQILNFHFINPILLATGHNQITLGFKNSLIQ